MKVFIGALVGLLLGSAIVAGLTVAGVAKNYWPILVVAVVAGMAMSRIASGSRAKYVKGGLAAVATALAMIAGQIGAAQILSKQSVEIGPMAASGSDATVVEEAAGDGAVTAEVPLAETEVILPVSTQPPVGTMSGRGGDISTTDIAFFAVGCLIAYSLGKGSDEPTNVVDESTDTPASDPDESNSASEADEK